jgi:hypothetical protein
MPMSKSTARSFFLVLLSLAISFLIVSISSFHISSEYAAVAQQGKSAVTPTPVAAILTWFQGNGVRLAVGLNQRRAQKDDIVDLSQRLLIPGTEKDEAKLGFVSSTSERTRIPGYLAQAGPSNIDAYYRFPCTNGRGKFMIAWWRVDGDMSNSTCNSVEVNLDTRIGPSANTNFTNSLTSNNIKQANAPREAKVYVRQYCNANAESGAWGLGYSREGFQWNGEITARQICNEALEKCRRAGGGDSCSIVSMSEWSAEETQHRLLLRCNDSLVVSEEVIGRNVYDGLRQIEQKYYEPLVNSVSSAAQQRSCRVAIQRSNSVLVSAVQGETSIQITNSDDGLIINTLTGAINIIPTDNPESPERIQAGEKYVYRKVTSRFEGEKNTLSNAEKKEIVQSAVVRSFLRESDWINSQYWSDNIAARIRKYRELIESEFCDGSPCLAPSSVNVDRLTVDGIDIWKAEVDLSNPETILTLARQEEIQQAGGIPNFLRANNAALATNGTFAEDSNWTMKSQGDFIVGGENDRFFSTYTVLGLKQNNQLEMNPRSQVRPQWDEYWFALTGHPRLVTNGNPGVTEVAPGSTLDQTGSRGRSAIGFSRNPNKLYYVATVDGVSLSRMSRIMKLVGCDEAMNLEGDSGRFLACNGNSKPCDGTLLVDGGNLKSPLIVVHDAQHVRDTVRANWQRYLSQFQK